MSPEAQAAIAVYQTAQSNLKSLLKQCSSGKELTEKGFEQDVDLAAELDVSDCVPTLVDSLFINGEVKRLDELVGRALDLLHEAGNAP